MIELDEYGNCPECGSSWDGGDIPEDIREHYSEPFKWSRLIGIEIPEKYDGISYWQCPDCGTKWDRWTNERQEKN